MISLCKFYIYLSSSNVKVFNVHFHCFWAVSIKELIRFYTKIVITDLYLFNSSIVEYQKEYECIFCADHHRII